MHSQEWLCYHSVAAVLDDGRSGDRRARGRMAAKSTGRKDWLYYHGVAAMLDVKWAPSRARARRSEDVTLLRYDDFFASKPVVFSPAFCEKSKKSQALRMTTWGHD